MSPFSKVRNEPLQEVVGVLANVPGVDATAGPGSRVDRTHRHSWNTEVVSELREVARQHKALDSLEDVLKRLDATGVALAGLEREGTNPTWAFNDLYTCITRRVDEGLQAGRFIDHEFMERLDIEFAKLYFDAIDAHVSGADVPTAWEYLFREEYQGRRHSNMEGALLGVNAHINHDLTKALLNADSYLPDATAVPARKADFDEINEIFRDEIGPIMRELIGQFTNGLKRWIWRKLDALFAKVDDWFILQLIESARDRAWSRAELIEPARRSTEAGEVDTDGMSAFWARIIAGLPFLSRRQPDDPELDAMELILTTDIVHSTGAGPGTLSVDVPGCADRTVEVGPAVALELLDCDDFLTVVDTAARAGRANDDLHRLADGLRSMRR